mgnify:FL=1|tara:strand:- start:407 stop:913 length:507 start_codon:yes stop_codon:yes gene_type:complete
MKMLLAFLAADSELLESHILNKAAAWAGGGENPMIHVEVVFVDREGRDGIIGRSCSIHYGGQVFLEQKRFSRAQWRFRSVSASETQIKKALKFCGDHVGEGFNKTGYFLQPFAGIRLSSDTWFCSEIVAGALNAAGFNVAPSLHPNALFKAVADLTSPDCPREVVMKF